MHFQLLKKKNGFLNSVRPAPPLCEFYSQNSVFFNWWLPKAWCTFCCCNFLTHRLCGGEEYLKMSSFFFLQFSSSDVCLKSLLRFFCCNFLTQLGLCGGEEHQNLFLSSTFCWRSQSQKAYWTFSIAIFWPGWVCVEGNGCVPGAGRLSKKNEKNGRKKHWKKIGVCVGGMDVCLGRVDCPSCRGFIIIYPTPT